MRSSQSSVRVLSRPSARAFITPHTCPTCALVWVFRALTKSKGVKGFRGRGVAECTSGHLLYRLTLPCARDVMRRARADLHSDGRGNQLRGVPRRYLPRHAGEYQGRGVGR